MKYWDFSCENVCLSDELVSNYNVSNLVGSVLSSRNIEVDEVKVLLDPIPRFHDPFLMHDMDKAVDVILQAVNNGYKIAVFGDYDCDGVTATAMLYHYLEQIGADAIFYIPNREAEGYGINSSAITSLHKMGIKLIITVDNGISAIEEAKLIKEYGMKLVITDHHTPQEILPEAEAIINPHKLECNYPFKHLCGAGVVFKLICALEGDEYGYDTLEEYSDILAIGTVADVVELRDENRFFVLHGLKSIANTHRIGLRKLLDSAGLSAEALNSESIGFGIAPRINAAGRIDNAEMGVLLFLTEYEQEADDIIAQLEECNVQRKNLEKQIIDDIDEQISKNPDIVNGRVLVFDGNNWNAGVVGIVCSRLVSRYGKPSIIISTDGELAKASGRSIDGFSLIDAIFSCSDLLVKYGGHPMAAGFSIAKENIVAFISKINKYAKENYLKMPIDKIKISHNCKINQLSLSMVESLDILEPFGIGNERPNFCVKGVTVEKIVSLTDNKHQRLNFNKAGEKFSVMFFSQRREQLICNEGDVVDVAFGAGYNYYNNEKRVSLKGIDIHPAQIEQDSFFDNIADIDNFIRGELKGKQYIPTRDEIAVVYRYVRSRMKMYNDIIKLYFESKLNNIDYFKFKIIIEILLDKKLLSIQSDYLVVNPKPEKVQLETSSVIKSLED